MTDKKHKALKGAPTRPANAVPDAPVAVVTAIKALHRGDASEHQQKMALQWIVREAGGKAHVPFHGEQTHDTAFALGRQFVADLIVGLFNAELSSLRQAEEG